MSASEADLLLRRLERWAFAFCVAAAAAALALRRGSPDVALGVLGGGALMAVSYWAIRSSIDGLVAVALGSAARATNDSEAPPPVALPGRRRARAVGYGLRFVGRYAVLGVLAYVMLVWLRLHPVGVLIGVSSIAFAAAVEAARSLSRPPGGR